MRGILSEDTLSMEQLDQEDVKTRIIYERDRELKVPPPLTSPFEVVPGLEKKIRDQEDAERKKKLGKVQGEPSSKEPDYLMT